MLVSLGAGSVFWCWFGFLLLFWCWWVFLLFSLFLNVFLLTAFPTFGMDFSTNG